MEFTVVDDDIQQKDKEEKIETSSVSSKSSDDSEEPQSYDVTMEDETDAPPVVEEDVITPVKAEKKEFPNTDLGIFMTEIPIDTSPKLERKEKEPEPEPEREPVQIDSERSPKMYAGVTPPKPDIKQKPGKPQVSGAGSENRSPSFYAVIQKELRESKGQLPPEQGTKVVVNKPVKQMEEVFITLNAFTRCVNSCWNRQEDCKPLQFSTTLILRVLSFWDSLI